MANTEYQLKQLRSTLSKMEIALSRVEECIVWTDRQGRIKWCNDALELLLGQPRMLLLSASLRDKLPLWRDGEQVASSTHPIALALDTHQSGKGCYDFHSSNRSYILEISWSFLKMDDHEQTASEDGHSSVLVLRDVTQRHIAETQLQESKRNLEILVAQRTQELQETNSQLQQESQQLQHLLTELQNTQAQLIQAEKMSGLGHLVAGIAHEINNPVNFIHGNLSHLREDTGSLLSLVHLYQKHYPKPAAEIVQAFEAIDINFLQGDVLKILNSMEMGTSRIREIVLSLRNFSRMDESEVKTVDIHEGIDSTLLMLKHRLGHSKAGSIQVIQEYGTLPLITCYAGQLNQVFMNIIVNAIDAIEEAYGSSKFEEHSHPMGQIIIQTLSLNPEWIQIVITDNGSGIPEQVQPHIFNPFFTTKPVGSGTGMGMAISYKIITQNHLGKLECRSTPGQGASFIIHIPIHPKVAQGVRISGSNSAYSINTVVI
jgi:two-component system, NtrC family, sensor kinase